jgi:hypothetical protein
MRWCLCRTRRRPESVAGRLAPRLPTSRQPRHVATLLPLRSPTLRARPQLPDPAGQPAHQQDDHDQGADHRDRAPQARPRGDAREERHLRQLGEARHPRALAPSRPCAFAPSCPRAPAPARPRGVCSFGKNESGAAGAQGRGACPRQTGGGGRRPRRAGTRRARPDQNPPHPRHPPTPNPAALPRPAGTSSTSWSARSCAR